MTTNDELTDYLTAMYAAQDGDPDFEMEPPSCDAVRPGGHTMFLRAPRCDRWVGHTEGRYPHDQHESGSPSGAILWPATVEEAREQRFVAARTEYGLPQIEGV